MENNDELKLYQEFKQILNHQIYPVQFSKDINLRLERIIHLLSLIGNPQRSYPVIHVGGTSGKGSTSTMISSVLNTAGYKTGLHTSPHIQIINEGFQINNKITPTLKLFTLLEEMKPAIDEVALENPFGSPSYFEVQVALALYLFKKEKVDVAVVEVGLGGSLDATNAIDAQIAVLTNIGLDHTDILGETIELIAQDKVGIIKSGQTVISGLTQSSTQKIIADRCKAQKAILWQLDKDFTFEYDQDKEIFSVSLPGREYNNLHENLLGDFQIRNATCALAAVHAFNPNLSADYIRQGLNHIKISGRMEIVQEEPTVLLDGAHNTDKIKAASSAVSKLFAEKRRVIVFALKRGKKFRDILPYVVDNASILIITSFSTDLWHPYNPEKLASYAQILDHNLEIHIEPDPIKAIELAFQLASPDDLIWVTGSLYLVGNVRNYWHPPLELLNSAKLHFG